MSLWNKTDVRKRRFRHPMTWCAVGSFFVFLAFLLSVGLGAVPIPPDVLIDAFLSFQPDNMKHQLVWEVRLPRALAALFIGAALAVAGAIMQGVTRNPLADPSIIGITQGAGLAIALCLAILSSGSYWMLLGWSFVGSAAASIMVLIFSNMAKERLSPVTIALAGAALSTLFSALSTGIALYFQIAQDVSFWFAGGLSGSKWQHAHILIPIVLVGLILSLWISRPLTLLSLGEEVATGLGQSSRATRIIGLVAVILLSSAAVSVAGTIGFIGLVIPHIVRLLVGGDYKWIVPNSAIAGAFLLLTADILARLINAPFETPVSAITAVLGVPILLHLARRKRRSI
jgi:iron complex transport system permease protein